jgi:hypothetical protein
MQALRQEEVRRAEGTSQLQDWNMECKDHESNAAMNLRVLWVIVSFRRSGTDISCFLGY